ncbi:hypothetical protein RP20_CCG003375, partial [Aedes albopictus]
GDVWCRVWLAVDVWMCTASILNLCAISLDRYVAVTRPVTYPSIMSTGRAKSLIAGLWVLSFVICFPPLVGWKEQKVSILGMGDAAPTPNPPCPWTCELTNDAGYVVYSALGSFYIPMFVMLFFYWRIYRAAERTTRAINQGFRTTKVTPCAFTATYRCGSPLFHHEVGVFHAALTARQCPLNQVNQITETKLAMLDYVSLEPPTPPYGSAKKSTSPSGAGPGLFRSTSVRAPPRASTEIHLARRPTVIEYQLGAGGGGTARTQRVIAEEDQTIEQDDEPSSVGTLDRSGKTITSL